MKPLLTWGGAAALICAATYISGFALLVTTLRPLGFGTGDIDPHTVLDFAQDNRALLMLWNLSIYVVNGLALVALAVALAARFRATLPGLGQMILAFGLLWGTLVTAAGMVANVGLEAALARFASDMDAAVELWRLVHVIELGLGGGNEIAGGIWAILIGAAILGSNLFSRFLGWFSLVIGGAGLATLVPALGEGPGVLFGLGYILWFIWIGVTLLRMPSPRLSGATS